MTLASIDAEHGRITSWTPVFPHRPASPTRGRRPAPVPTWPRCSSARPGATAPRSRRCTTPRAARVHGLALRVVRDPAQAEEVTQEAFLEIWRTASRYDADRGSAVSWLLTIAHRKAVDRVRSAEASSRRESTYHHHNQTVDHDTTADAATASLEARRVRTALGAAHRGPARGDRAGVLRRLHPHRGGHPPRPTGRDRKDQDSRRPDPAPRHDRSRTMTDHDDTQPDWDNAHALSGAYAVDALDDFERARFEAHLRGCADCRIEVESLPRDRRRPRVRPGRAARRAARRGARRHRVDPSAAAAHRARTVRRPPSRAPTSTVVRDDRPAPRRRGAGAGRAGDHRRAATVGIRRPGPPPTEQVLEAADRQDFEQEFPDGSTATVVVSRSEGRAVIVTEDMALAPDGKVYELWFQDPAGAMIPAGLMPDEDDADRAARGRRERGHRGRDHRRARRRLGRTDDPADRPLRDHGLTAG